MPFTEVINHRPSRLFVYLAGFFVANALVAELIGVKIFALENTLGLAPWNFNLFGEVGALQFSAGVLLWPVVFVMTDLLNEYYGQRGVRLLSYLTVGLIGYAFVMIFAAIQLSPADWWVAGAQVQGVPDNQAAFRVTFGQGLFIIIGSLLAFLIAQLTDVFVFHRIRRRTGEEKLWLRATGSTLVSQLVDSFVVLYVAFKLGPELFGGVTAPWPWSRILAVATVQYVFKFTMAIVLTPVIYWLHALIDRYLGEEVSAAMRARATIT
ncbi:queuosine precursor transporter [Lewinella sp. JB7]|uniref:queuosine precursor transporter n=1 Tax=Lewinella sp. JB7 TaxID=2962887 RepID=UPI0020C9B466|nr:queuosine precursor transporter [Lewinella sp. JB7]MCP9235717.1 queuosine precursor transporter [Lewinella sp. JB7]